MLWGRMAPPSREVSPPAPPSGRLGFGTSPRVHFWTITTALLCKEEHRMTPGTPARAQNDLGEQLDVDDQQVEVEVPVAVPAPSFANFGVSKEVVDALAMRNIDGTFEIQALVLSDAIAGRDVLAKSRTGSGKTLAFAVPIVERLEHDQKSPTALILVPTRELATQVADQFRGIIDPNGMKGGIAY